MFEFSLSCSGFASVSGTASGKKLGGHVHSVHAVAMPLNTYRASRACRDERVVPYCPTSATQHVTTFFCVKMHGLDRVSCRDSKSGIRAYAVGQIAS